MLDAEVEVPATRPGQKTERRRYSESCIQSRARIVQLAIAARKFHRPDEEPYDYEPLRGESLDADSLASIKAALQHYSDGTIFI